VLNSALKIVRKYHPEVNSVIDALKDVRVVVSKTDCNTSKKKSPSECAMAKACLKHYDGAIISLSTAYLIKGKRARRYKVPHAVSRELVSFDRHKEFAPGVYTLKAPTFAKLLGAQGGNKPRIGKKRIFRNHATAGIRAL